MERPEQRGDQTMSDEGQIRKESMIRFERVLPGPIERVWDYLTRSEHLATWFGGGAKRYVIEPREGGAVSLEDGHIRGVVTRWQPPRLLTYTWNVFMPGDAESKYPESYVTWELTSQGDDVLLTLTHRPIMEGFEAQAMMGWHTFLDRLGALLRGDEPEALEVLMERHGARYGVTEIKR
jgi:uncharacterized protein YndB with AHSA1/START domain